MPRYRYPSLPPCPLMALLCLSLSLPAAAQQDEQITQAISLGAYYAKGDYGEASDTSIHYLPLSYEANVGKWGFQLMVPHLEVTGLGNVLVNIGGVTRAVAGTDRTTESGLGDSVATLIYRTDPISARAPFIDLRMDVKIPTADERKSLGTGETDYSVQVDLSQNLGSSAVFASVGYNFRGSSEIFEGLEDSAFVQLGLVRPISERWSVGLIYDFREAASSFSPESHELLPYFSWRFSEHWSLTGFASWGFTDASADTTVLGQLRYDW